MNGKGVWVKMAAKSLEFELAAILRDEIKELRHELTRRSK